jgi:ferric-dicitrate binding protein FerR (iron transport regulator)
VGDEPTNGELARRLDAGFEDLKDDMRTLAGRLDTKVDASLLALQQQAQDDRHAAAVNRITEIEKARERETQQRQQDQREMENRRAGDKRLMLTALVAPLLLLLLQVYLASKGSS